jgi:hypothetical protein
MFGIPAAFHAELCIAIVNAEAGLAVSSCLDFQDDFNDRWHA